MTNPTQADRILAVLQEHIGEWTNGRYFIQTMMISQAHTRIFELQRKGYKVEASDFKDEYGFKSYRLVDQDVEKGGVDITDSEVAQGLKTFLEQTEKLNL